MTLAATYHVRSDTIIRVVPGTHLHDGRAMIFVVSEGLTIVGDRWEDLQRLVLVLHDAIAEARQAEDHAAATVIDSATDISAGAPLPAGDDDPRIGICPAPDWSAMPSEQRVQAAEAELVEAGGVRVLVQRDARAQLRAEGLPVSRATVTLRAVELLHARTTQAALP